jgi:hypothetical protein
MINFFVVSKLVLVRVMSLAVAAGQTPSPSAVPILMNLHWISISRDLRAT